MVPLYLPDHRLFIKRESTAISTTFVNEHATLLEEGCLSSSLKGGWYLEVQLVSECSPCSRWFLPCIDLRTDGLCRFSQASTKERRWW